MLSRRELVARASAFAALAAAGADRTRADEPGSTIGPATAATIPPTESLLTRPRFAPCPIDILPDRAVTESPWAALAFRPNRLKSAWPQSSEAPTAVRAGFLVRLHHLVERTIEEVVARGIYCVGSFEFNYVLSSHSCTEADIAPFAENLRANDIFVDALATPDDYSANRKFNRTPTSLGEVNAWAVARFPGTRAASLAIHGRPSAMRFPARRIASSIVLKDWDEVRQWARELASIPNRTVCILTEKQARSLHQLDAEHLCELHEAARVPPDLAPLIGDSPE